MSARKRHHSCLPRSSTSHSQLPDHLAAIGITIESSVRTKENALACRGFFLDIENGDMTPEDFAEAFPDLEFFACSSWSHTPDARRYRIAIPSTQLIPPEMHSLILHTIVDRLEAAGWGDALSDGKKHGVDLGKLHEAAMFYLPSKRPDCFLMHIHEGRNPLDPCEWVNHIPDDLLISPPPPVPPEIYQHGDAPAHKDKRVEWAMYAKCGSTIGGGVDVSGATAGRSYGSWRNVSPKPVVLTRRCAASSTSRQVSPRTRGSDARKSKRCSEIVMLSLQGARRDDSKDQDLRRSGGGDLRASPSGIPDAFIRSSSSCFSVAAVSACRCFGMCSTNVCTVPSTSTPRTE